MGRQLHALLLPPGQAIRDALARALDGGPAIAPLDPSMPAAQLKRTLNMIRPNVIVTTFGEETPTEKPALTENDVALVVCTSGSTGLPKAVELTADSLLASARGTLDFLGADDAPWLCSLPTWHIAGLQVITRALLANAPLEIQPKFTVEGFISHDAPPVVNFRGSTRGQYGRNTPEIDHWRSVGVGTRSGFVSLVPTMLHRLVEARVDLSSFRRILVGGAPPSSELLAAAAELGANITVTYGATETSGGCVYDGQPLPGVEVTLEPFAPLEPANVRGILGQTAVAMDPQTATFPKMPNERHGRVRITGAVVARRYRNLATESAAEGHGEESTTSLGFTTHNPLRSNSFLTSDLGEWAADGRLVIHGRIDDVIITGGVKVHASAVAEALRTAPGVRDAVVFGETDPEWGQRVVAEIVPADPSNPPKLSELRDHVSAQLGKAATPQRLMMR